MADPQDPYADLPNIAEAETDPYADLPPVQPATPARKRLGSTQATNWINLRSSNMAAYQAELEKLRQDPAQAEWADIIEQDVGPVEHRPVVGGVGAAIRRGLARTGQVLSSPLMIPEQIAADVAGYTPPKYSPLGIWRGAGQAVEAEQQAAQQSFAPRGTVAQLGQDVLEAGAGSITDPSITLLPAAAARAAVSAGGQVLPQAADMARRAANAIGGTIFGTTAAKNLVELPQDPTLGDYANAFINAAFEAGPERLTGLRGEFRRVLETVPDPGTFLMRLREVIGDSGVESLSELVTSAGQIPSRALFTQDGQIPTAGEYAHEMAVAGLTGFGQSAAMNAPALADTRGAADANFDRAIAEAAQRQAALEAPAVGVPAEVLNARNIAEMAGNELAHETIDPMAVPEEAQPEMPLPVEPEMVQPEPQPEMVQPEPPQAEPEQEAEAPQEDPAVLDEAIANLDAEFARTRNPDLLTQRAALVARRAKADVVQRAGLTGRKLMTLTTEQEQAAVAKQTDVAEAKREAIDKALAKDPRQPTKLKKPGAPVAPRPVTPQDQEVEELDRIMNDPARPIAERRAARDRLAAIVTGEGENPNIVQAMDEPGDGDQQQEGETYDQYRRRMIEKKFTAPLRTKQGLNPIPPTATTRERLAFFDHIYKAAGTRRNSAALRQEMMDRGAEVADLNEMAEKVFKAEQYDGRWSSGMDEPGEADPGIARLRKRVAGRAIKNNQHSKLSAIYRANTVEELRALDTGPAPKVQPPSTDRPEPVVSNAPAPVVPVREKAAAVPAPRREGDEAMPEDMARKQYEVVEAKLAALEAELAAMDAADRAREAERAAAPAPERDTTATQARLEAEATEARARREVALQRQAALRKQIAERRAREESRPEGEVRGVVEAQQAIDAPRQGPALPRPEPEPPLPEAPLRPQETGRAPTEAERHEAAMEQDKATFAQSLPLRVEFPTNPKGELVRLAPLSDGRTLKPRIVVEATSGQQMAYAPPAFAIGRLESGPHTGSYAVFMVKPKYFEKPNATVMSAGSMPILVPRVKAATPELAGKLRELANARTVAQQTLDAEQPGSEAHLAALTRGKELNAEIDALVGEKFRATNAPYWLALNGAQASALRKNPLGVTQYLYPTFEDAHQASLTIQEQNFRAVADADPGVTVEGTAATVEAGGDEDAPGNTGFGAEARDLEGMEREPSKYEGMTESEKAAAAAEIQQASRAGERIGELRKMNARNPAHRDEALRKWDELHQTHARAARAWLARVSRDDATQAWMAAALRGDKDHMKRAERAIKALEGEYAKLVKPEKPVPEGERVAQEARRRAAATPFLQRGRGVPYHEQLYSAFKDQAPIENVGYLPVGLQYAVRLAQAYNPGVTFSVGFDTKTRGGQIRFDDYGVPVEIDINFDLESYNTTQGDDKNGYVRKAVGSVAHEWFHAAMAQEGVSKAVFTAMESVLGADGMARLVEGARASWVKGGNKVWEAVWQRQKAHADTVGVPVPGMTAEQYADSKTLEEIIAFAVSLQMRDGLFATDTAEPDFGVTLAKAIFTHPAMGATLDEKALIARLGVEAATTKTGLAFINHHLSAMNSWIDSVAANPDLREAEAKREDDQTQMGTVSEDYKAGQEVRENRPEVRDMYLAPIVRENLRELAEVVTAAIRYQSGRVISYREIDGKQVAVVNDTWMPETEMGKAVFADLKALGPPLWAKLNRGHRAESKPTAMDEPGEADPYTEESADELINIRRQEFIADQRKRRRDMRYKGSEQAKPETLRERFKTAAEHTGRAAKFFGTQYRELGTASDLPGAITAQLLDQYYNRVVQGRSKSENAIRDIAAPLLEAKRRGATQAQIDEAHDAFGDYAVLRDVQEAVNQGIANGTFFPGETRIPLMNQGDRWEFGTDLALFTQVVEDARQRMLTNPTAYAMMQRYDATFEALRAEAARLGVAEELSPYYYHRQVLMFTTPDAKERRQKMMDAMAKDSTSVAKASANILKERGGSLADFNLNVWESLDEAVMVFDRMLARAELSNGVMTQVSQHNRVIKAIQDTNAEETRRVLAMEDDDPDVVQTGSAFTARKEQQGRLFRFFGSLLHSDHTLADRPWVENHRAVLEKIKEAYNPKHSTADMARAKLAVSPAEYRALAIDAYEDSPPLFQQMIERVVLGGQYLEPFDLAKAAILKPDLIPEGHTVAPVPFKPPQPSFIDDFAGAGDNFATISRRVMASMGYAAASPQAVLPDHIARELGTERAAREEAINKRTYGAWATARKVSVMAQLSSPLTIPRYLLMNVIGNSSAMVFHDPASVGYVFAAGRLLFKYYNRPASLTPEERLLVKTLEKEHLLSTGLGAEFRNSNNALIQDLGKLTTYQAEKSLPARFWQATWGKWDRFVSPGRRFVDDYARVAMFMREVQRDPYLSQAMGSAIQVGIPGRAWSAIWNKAKGESGLAKTRQQASAMLEAMARTGDAIDDIQQGRRVAQFAAARVQGSLGNYGALSRFGESFLGRGTINVFQGFTDNVVRQTITALRNDLSHPSLAGKAKGAARGLLLLSAGPLLVRALNAMLHDDDEDEDYRAFLDNPRASPWFDLYMGNWGGKPRVLGISTVLGDTLRPLGFGQIDKDIAAAIEYAGTDDWGTIVRTGKQVLGQQMGYLFDPQIAYLDMVPTMAGYRWNAKELTFAPVYDQTRQLLQPWGLGGTYDFALPYSGQTTGGWLADTMTRVVDSEGAVITRAKAAVERFNKSTGVGSGTPAMSVNEEARMRNALRRALLNGDNQLAESIVGQLYSLENRAIGPDNLLKSFGASSVYHRLGNDGRSTRDQMREKLHRWLPPEERELLVRAEDLQERTFNPWRNPQLMTLLKTSAKTPDLQFRTARVISGSLNTAVAETRTSAGVTSDKAILLVAKDLGLPARTVRQAYELHKQLREISTAKRTGNTRLEATLTERYLRQARKAGFID